MTTDTIAAIATNQTGNSIGVVKISGNDAKKIGEKIIRHEMNVSSVKESPQLP